VISYIISSIIAFDRLPEFDFFENLFTEPPEFWSDKEKILCDYQARLEGMIYDIIIAMLSSKKTREITPEILKPITQSIRNAVLVDKPWEFTSFYTLFWNKPKDYEELHIRLKLYQERIAAELLTAFTGYFTSMDFQNAQVYSRKKAGRVESFLKLQTAIHEMQENLKKGICKNAL
jgi:hypothetical protein